MSIPVIELYKTPKYSKVSM